MSSYFLWSLVIGFILNTVLFTTVVVFLAKRLKRGRPPRGMNEKLLRCPGEHLQQELAALDDQFTEQLFMGIFVPVVILLIPLPLVPLAKGYESLVVVLALGGFLLSFILRVWRVRNICEKIRTSRLGLLGERAVAAALQPLLAKGYAIFHDMPAQGTQKSFNLDHVVIGPSGLFVIETKARRKIHQDANGNDHIVKYDGKTLRWPQGNDQQDLHQAAGNATWLQQFVEKRLGLRVNVVPLLVLPGWYVDRTGTGAVRVVNEVEAEKTVLGRPVLDEKEVDQIKRQLDIESRTVSFDA
jgi:hypothetical protein